MQKSFFCIILKLNASQTFQNANKVEQRKWLDSQILGLLLFGISFSHVTFTVRLATNLWKIYKRHIFN